MLACVWVRQLWTFMHQYIESSSARGLDPVAVAHFLFKLSYCQVGQAYAVAELDATQRHMLGEMVAFGLIARRAKCPQW